LCFLQVHRAAKLKQCKLDARREQWLAQGSSRKLLLVSFLFFLICWDIFLGFGLC
jgi:hypothetical protein